MTKIFLVSSDTKVKQPVEFTLRQVEGHSHQYYNCYKTQRGKDDLRLFKFNGLANPSIPLIELYRLLAIPTENIITREFVLFLIKCMKVYKASSSYKVFLLEMYHSNVPVSLRKGIENEQINQLITNIWNMNEKKLLLYTLQIQTDPQFNHIFKSKELQFYQKRATQHVNDLVIIPQAQKWNKLKNLCENLKIIWKTELFYDKDNGTTFILTKSYKKNEQNHMMVLEQFIEIGYKQKGLIEQQEIQSLSFQIIKKIEDFNDEIRMFTNEQTPFYHLDLKNIFVEILKKQSQEVSISTPINCQLNYMQPFIKQLGLEKSPSTFENFLIFHSTPRPYLFSFTFQEILRDEFKQQNYKTRYEIQTSIKWLLLTDHMYCKLMQKCNVSFIERHANKKQIIQALIDSPPSKALHINTKTIINVLKLKNPNASTSLKVLQLFNLKNLNDLNEYDSKNDPNYEPNKYVIIKNSIDFKVKMYFDTDSLKNFCERNKFIQFLNNAGRYTCLYLLAKYAQMESQRQLLELWNGEEINIEDPKYQLMPSLEKFRIVCQKIEIKLQSIVNSNDYMANWTQNLQSIMVPAIQLYKTLKDCSFGFYFKNTLYIKKEQKLKHIEEVINKLKENINRLFDLIQLEIQKQVQTEQKLITNKDLTPYLSARKSLSLKSIFLGLNFYNYSYLVCEEERIWNYKPKVKEITKEEVKKKFEEFDKSINEIIQTKTKYFFQQLHQQTKDNSY